MFRSVARALARPRAVGLSLGGALGASGLGVVCGPQHDQQGAVRCHCQVPCGIFHDDGRIAAILEDAMTIRKAVAQSQELFKAKDLQSLHQTVRWITTKEEHASKIMTTVSEYFLAQKVKKDQLGHAEYLEVLALHHAVMVAAMKTKQSADMSVVDALDAAIEALKKVYVK